MSIRYVLTAFCLALAMACSKEGNPVALPTDPGGSPSALLLGLKTDQSPVYAGTTSPATLTVTAVRADGSPAPEGTTVTLNTTLGGFAFDSTGKPVQITTVTLVTGRATLQFFAGATVGTATIMATTGGIVTTLNLPIAAAPPAPVANFTFDPNGLTVIFHDASTGSPTTFAWDFGDGQTSSAQNPSHTYAAAATYHVTLTVTNIAGSSNIAQFVPVSLGNPPQAAFDYTVSSVINLQVNFVDQSVGATSWGWSFGDGTHDSVRNPIHTYAGPGVYTVTLAASNAAGTSTANKVVTISAGTPPKAAFMYTILGNQVNFIDASTGSPSSWSWAFGDGTTSTARNPIHTYPTSGAFTVTLMVMNAAGSDTVSQAVVITPDLPVSQFTYKPNGLQVNFADASTGNPSSWSWTFGDGGTSTQQNPVHNYPAFGNYTVTLKVTNAAGANSSTQIVTLTAPPPPPAPVASFTATVNNMQVNFVDTSSGNPTIWSWSFGDNTSSAQQNPVHTYASAGSYTVTLRASNSAGSSNATQVVIVPPPSSAQ